jgi:hypothetical protein
MFVPELVGKDADRILFALQRTDYSNAELRAACRAGSNQLPHLLLLHGWILQLGLEVGRRGLIGCGIPQSVGQRNTRRRLFCRFGRR